jgi:hypothetical protein
LLPYSAGPHCDPRLVEILVNAFVVTLITVAIGAIAVEAKEGEE